MSQRDMHYQSGLVNVGSLWDITCMRRVRYVLLILLAVCAFPLGSSAQWAVGYTEHDWSIKIGGNSYGLIQRYFNAGIPMRTTTIYLGPYTAHTAVRAVVLAVAALVPTVAAGAFVFIKLLPGADKRGSALR